MKHRKIKDKITFSGILRTVEQNVTLLSLHANIFPMWTVEVLVRSRLNGQS